MNVKLVTTIGTLAIALVCFSGCGKSSEKMNTSPNNVSGEAHVHGEWWCGEHGVPEAVCAQCNTELVADFKAKGDWCKEHDRPNSQCFICHPELEAKFAAQYEAKYGKKPPKPQDSGKQAHADEGKKS